MGTFMWVNSYIPRSLYIDRPMKNPRWLRKLLLHINPKVHYHITTDCKIKYVCMCSFRTYWFSFNLFCLLSLFGNLLPMITTDLWMISYILDFFVVDSIFTILLINMSNSLFRSYFTWEQFCSPRPPLGDMCPISFSFCPYTINIITGMGHMSPVEVWVSNEWTKMFSFYLCFFLFYCWSNDLFLIKNVCEFLSIWHGLSLKLIYIAIFSFFFSRPFFFLQSKIIIEWSVF